MNKLKHKTKYVREVTSPVQIRLSEKQKKFIQRKANKYTEGNLSAWIRMSAIEFEPELD